MVGAVPGTPGTLPTDWSVSVPAGLTTNVIGTGVESGIPYVDLQIVGTATSTIWNIVQDNVGIAASRRSGVGRF